MPGRQILLALAQKYSKTLAKIITYQPHKGSPRSGILAGQRSSKNYHNRQILKTDSLGPFHGNFLQWESLYH
jgi:hypothetical protein